MKSSLVSHRTFQLVLHLTNSFEPGYGSGCLQKTPAFQALLCDLDVGIQILPCYCFILFLKASENLNVSLFFRCGRILQTVCIFQFWTTLLKSWIPQGNFHCYQRVTRPVSTYVVANLLLTQMIDKVRGTKEAFVQNWWQTLSVVLSTFITASHRYPGTVWQKVKGMFNRISDRGWREDWMFEWIAVLDFLSVGTDCDWY